MSIKKLILLTSIILLVLLFFGCKKDNKGGYSMKLTSEVFEHEAMIPAKYTCDGKDISPPLQWENVPENTKSFALICDDPDAPVGTWVHWVIFNIPADSSNLKEDVLPKKTLANGTKQGINDFQKIGYGGPCPPGEEHRYFFKLYALDKKLDLEPPISKSELVNAMENHIIEKTELIGNYAR